MKRTNPSLSRRVGGLAIVGLAITVAACTQKEDETSPSIHLAPRVAITSVEGDTTSELLAAIYARSMENTGVRVVRKDPVAMDRAQYVQAITDGQFQMIPEFSRGLLNFLLDSSSSGSTTTTPTTDGGPATTRAPITIPTTVPPTSEPATSAPGSSEPAVSSSAAPTTEPTSTEPASTEPASSGPATDVSTSSGDSTTTTVAPTNGFSLSAQIVAINTSIDDTLVAYGATILEDRITIACTPAYMQANAAYQLFTYTDLASLAPSTRFAASAEFIADEAEGLPKFLAVYAAEFAETLAIEADAIADAVANDTADCFAVDSLDPVITAEDLAMLLDDQYMIPNNAGIALLATTSSTPEVTAALDRVASALTTDKFNQLLREVLVNGTDITVVANAFVDNIPSS